MKQFFISILFLLTSSLNAQYIGTTVSGGSPSNLSPLVDELKAGWSFEESSGNALDLVNGYDLTNNGSVNQQETGIIDYCCFFDNPDGPDAGDEYFGGDIDTDFEFTGTFSIAVWVKTTVSTAYDGIVANYYTDNGWDLGNYNNVATFAIRNGGSGSTIVDGTTTINDGNWHLVCVSYDGAGDDSLKVWTDSGTFEDSGTRSGISYTSQCRLNVGRRHTTNWFRGYIDELFIFEDYELTDDDVAFLYNSGAGKYYPWEE